jgi:hypothetical protein
VSIWEDDCRAVCAGGRLILRAAAVRMETILKKRGETIAATAIKTYMERGLS